MGEQYTGGPATTRPLLFHIGAKATIHDMFGILARDDPEAADVVRRQLQREGISVREDIKVSGVLASDGGVTVEIEGDDSVFHKPININCVRGCVPERSIPYRYR